MAITGLIIFIIDIISGRAQWAPFCVGSREETSSLKLAAGSALAFLAGSFILIEFDNYSNSIERSLIMKLFSFSLPNNTLEQFQFLKLS